MRKFMLKPLTTLTVAILLISTLSAFTPQVGRARPTMRTLATVLKPGVWRTFVLGPSSAGKAYLVDINPLKKSVNGAYIQSEIRPQYNGKRWMDVLRVLLPAEFPQLPVQINVYQPRNLTTVLDGTDSFPPGEWRGYPVGEVGQYTGGYLVDLDPLAAAVKGAYIQRYLVHPEFPWGAWLDILRVQTAETLPSAPLPIRMRVYLASGLPLVAELNVTLTPADQWTGFIIGPSALKRAYLVRAVPLTTDNIAADLNQFIIQPEFDGQQWNDVLRIEMRNTDWGQIDYNFKVYVCNRKACP